MKLRPSQKERLRKNWTPLAEMHLLLREHGWKPELEGEHWVWTRRGLKKTWVVTQKTLTPAVLAPCTIMRRGERSRKYLSAAGLSRRLKELAKNGHLPQINHLPEMHRYLRRKGWKPRKHQDLIGPRRRYVWWDWKHPKHTLRIHTKKDDKTWLARWWRGWRIPGGTHPSTSPYELARFVERLPGKKPTSPR